jgi:hypothetical protein
MQKKTQHKILSIVRQYKQIFPEEYEAGVLSNKQRADHQATKWGEFADGSDIGREVLRMPTTLHAILSTKLTNDELKEMEHPKGLVWMQRTFPQFVPNRSIE